MSLEQVDIVFRLNISNAASGLNLLFFCHQLILHTLLFILLTVFSCIGVNGDEPYNICLSVFLMCNHSHPFVIVFMPKLWGVTVSGLNMACDNIYSCHPPNITNISYCQILLTTTEGWGFRHQYNTMFFIKKYILYH